MCAACSQIPSEIRSGYELPIQLMTRINIGASKDIGEEREKKDIHKKNERENENRDGERETSREKK